MTKKPKCEKCGLVKRRIYVHSGQNKVAIGWTCLKCDSHCLEDKKEEEV